MHLMAHTHTHTNTHTHTHTDRQMDMATLWLNQPSGADSVKNWMGRGQHTTTYGRTPRLIDLLGLRAESLKIQIFIIVVGNLWANNNLPTFKICSSVKCCPAFYIWQQFHLGSSLLLDPLPVDLTAARALLWSQEMGLRMGWWGHTTHCCTESVPRREEGRTGKYKHKVEGVPEGAARGNSQDGMLVFSCTPWLE